MQIAANELKLKQYIGDPLSADNKGHLAGAMDDPALYEKIYQERVRSLRKQIENFKRQLEECEKRNAR